MAQDIDLSLIMKAGQNLFQFGGVTLPGNITAEMYGAKMVIKEGTTIVFTMKLVKIIDDELMVDYPKTAEGQAGRGWGLLGMLLALYYGQYKGCTSVALGSEIEIENKGSVKLWAKFGIPKSSGTPMQHCLSKIRTWILSNCQQANQDVITFHMN